MKGWLQFFVSGLMLVQSAQVSACEFRFAAEVEFPPHLIQDKDLRWHGQSVELLQALATKVGCKIDFRSSPWVRSLLQLKTGELDVISHLYHNAERDKDYYFIGPHHLEAIWLIGKPADFTGLKNLSDLSTIKPAGRIAVLNGAYYGENFAALSKEPAFAAQLVTISSIQDKLALLNANRVDAILEDRSVLHFWQRENRKQAHSYQPILQVYEAPVYFGFSKKSISKTQFEALQRAWKEIAQDQTIQTIQSRYQLR